MKYIGVILSTIFAFSKAADNSFLNTGGTTYGSGTFGRRFTHINDNFFTVQSAGGQYLFEAGTDAASVTFKEHLTTSIYNDVGCGNVYVEVNHIGNIKTYLLDPNSGTLTLVSSITASSLLSEHGISVFGFDKFGIQFTEDCSKFFMISSSTGTATGFKVFDVDPSTAVMTFNYEHLCSPAVCGDGSVDDFHVMAGKFAVSGDGLHVFASKETRNNNDGGVLHYKYSDGSWSESWITNGVTGDKFGFIIDAKQSTLVIRAKPLLAEVYIYTESNGDYVFDHKIVGDTISYAEGLVLYNDFRICMFDKRPINVADSGKITVIDKIDGTWTEKATFTSGYQSSSWSNIGGGGVGLCTNTYVITGDQSYDSNTGRVDIFNIAAAPVPPAACITSPDCPEGEYCRGSQCYVQKSCTEHSDCIGELDSGRLPFCNKKQGKCQDVKASTCSSTTLCDMVAQKHEISQKSVGNLVQDLGGIDDSVKRSEAASSSIEKLKEQATVEQDIEVFVAATETVELRREVFDSAGEQTVLDEIKQIRCGDAADYCTITLDTGSGRRLSKLRNLQELHYTVNIVYDVSDDVFAQISNSTSFDDPEFKNALINATGVDAADVVITATDGTLTLSFTLVEESSGDAPVDETVFDDIASLQDSLNTVTSEVVAELEIEASAIETQELDLCNNRDCNGLGAELCDSETGVCACPDGYWGVNCDLPCTCENGGECVGSYCMCSFPYYNLRCTGVANLGPVINP